MTVATSLVVLALFYLINLNFQSLLAQEARKAQISAYLDRGLSEAQLARVRKEIEALPEVGKCEYVSSEAAWERTKKSLDSEFLDLLQGASRLPAKFSVRPAEPEATERLAGQLAGIKGVEDVRYGAEIVGRLNRLVWQVRRVGWGLLALLAFATCAIISNAIRLTIYARRREIRIMQLVGATNGFVRAPFVLEGLVHGVTGALLAVAVSFLLYGQFREAAATVTPFLRLVGFEELMPQLALGLLGVGVLFGVGGSLLSMRRFLREV
jgi:cell division transport system permease protein